MSHNFIILLLIGLSVAQQTADDCSDIEYFNDCGGCTQTDACPTPSSQTQAKSEVINCPDVCVPRCECTFGYKRATNGTCIPFDQCPDPCADPNAEYTVCGSACPDPDACPALREPYQYCLTVCVEGCFCKEGYYRYNGECVPESECPCPENEKYSDCNTFYPNCGDDRCPALIDPTYTCVNKRCPFGCFCIEEGFRRNQSGDCVPICECPKKCPNANEYFNPYGPSCYDQELCPNLRKNVTCRDVYQEKCTCSDNYFRNGSGECIPASKC